MTGYTGWIPRPGEVEAFCARLPNATLAAAAPQLVAADQLSDWFAWEQGELPLFNRLLPAHAQEIGDCFAAGTMIVGNYTKPIENIRVGDEVLTAQGNLSTVISTTQKNVMTPLFCIKALGALPLTVTADHKLWVMRASRSQGKKNTPARLDVLKSKGGINCTMLQQMQGSIQAVEPEWVAAQHLTVDDYLLLPTTINISGMRPQYSFTAHAELDYVFGVFIGDGSISKDNGVPRTIEFTCSEISTSDRLLAIFNSMGLRPKLDASKSAKAWRVRVHSTSIAKWFDKEFYDENRVKHFPLWLVGSELALNGLFDADGCLCSGTKSITNTSHSVIYGASMSLAKVGKVAAISEHKRGEGCYANAKPLMNVHWTDQKRKRCHLQKWGEYIAYPIRKITVKEGESLVYDVGVADAHHSLIANGVGAKNCVSHGYARAVQDQLYIDTAQRRKGQASTAVDVIQIATEPIYGFSRIEIGKGRLGRGDGSIGAWAAEAVKELGVLARKSYGSLDLTRYRPDLARSWGSPKRGVPDELEPEARLHVVQHVALVTTEQELRAAVSNGYNIPICSGQGFREKRDQNGICAPSGSWAHCMTSRGGGVLKGNRPVIAIQQSWGNNPTGPDVVQLESGRELKLPQGVFLVDWEVAMRMLRERDSFAVSGPTGFSLRQPLPWKLFHRRTK